VSPVNPIQKYWKLFYLVEALLSVVLPVALVAVVLGDQNKYSLFSRQVISCGPPTIELFFYTMALPLQVIVTLGIMMALYILFQLYKVTVNYKVTIAHVGTVIGHCFFSGKWQYFS
jgi:hypothetical protein